MIIVARGLINLLFVISLVNLNLIHLPFDKLDFLRCRLRTLLDVLLTCFCFCDLLVSQIYLTLGLQQSIRNLLLSGLGLFQLHLLYLHVLFDLLDIRLQFFLFFV